jgi:hypothetical protein
MKLLSVVLARTAWLFDFGQFNPKGLNLWPVCERLIEKYHFAAHPKHLLDLDEDKSLAFKVGSFTNAKRESVTINFSIYNNGLAVDAYSSTDDSADFLQQVTGFVATEFGLIIPPDVYRLSLSQLEVESEFALSAVHPALLTIAQTLSSCASTVDGKPRNFDFGALQLWAEDWNPTTAPAYFRFERKIGQPFSSNHYFSQAALKTQEHFELLKLFEDAFKKPPVIARP